MASCVACGKKKSVGNNVSHANNKTKRVFRPNLQTVTLASDALGRAFSLRISMNALKSIDRRGGLDAFILKARDAVLSPRALRLKHQLAKRQTTSAT